MIYGETIKSAFATRLAELFPNVAIYKEKEEEATKFPNFFILQLTLNSQEDRKDHYWLTYYVTIRYREVADINTEPKLQQKLDKVGSEMIINLVDIPINNKPFKLKNCNCEKVDGVLHFFANVTVQVVKEPPQEALMRKLEGNIDIKTTKGDN